MGNKTDSKKNSPCICYLRDDSLHRKSKRVVINSDEEEEALKSTNCLIDSDRNALIRRWKKEIRLSESRVVDAPPPSYHGEPDGELEAENERKVDFIANFIKRKTSKIKRGGSRHQGLPPGRVSTRSSPGRSSSGRTMVRTSPSRN